MLMPKPVPASTTTYAKIIRPAWNQSKPLKLRRRMAIAPSGYSTANAIVMRAPWSMRVGVWADVFLDAVASLDREADVLLVSRAYRLRVCGVTVCVKNAVEQYLVSEGIRDSI